MRLKISASVALFGITTLFAVSAQAMSTFDGLCSDGGIAKWPQFV